MLYCDTWETCNILDRARNTCRGPVRCQPVTGWWYFIWLIAATPVTGIRIWSIDYECNRFHLYYGLHNNRYFPLLEERVQSNIWQQHLTTWRQRIYHSVYWLDSNVPNNLSTLASCRLLCELQSWEYSRNSRSDISLLADKKHFFYEMKKHLLSAVQCHVLH